MANIKKDRDEYQGRRQSSRSRRLSESAHISRDQVGELFLQTEPVSMPIQEEDRVPLIIDASNLNEDELAELRIIDPFLYYSIDPVCKKCLLAWVSDIFLSRQWPSSSAEETISPRCIDRSR